ncbi:MAG: Na+/H+ antiporter subunit D [Geminicoccaceae bacterium]
MSWLLIAPILAPMITAALVFLAPTDRLLRGQISVLGSVVFAILGAILLKTVWQDGPIATDMGGWPAPFGITLVADLFSAVMVLAAGLVGIAVAIYALADIDHERAAGGFDSFLQMLLAGVSGAFLTGDLFNLYVWFEVMLIASFALMTLGGDKRQLDGAVKYVAINLISTVLLLTAIGLLYGLAGSLNMADLHGKLGKLDQQGLLGVIAVLFLIAFGIKAAIFPLFFWLPASYHTPPVAISAVFAGLMTKVGIYALTRTFTLIFPAGIGLINELMLASALITMIVGVLGAIAQTDIRRILAFQVIASIGFLLLGFSLQSPLATAAAVFYMVHAILLKTQLFMTLGIIGRESGSFELHDLGGLYRRRPGLAITFLLGALALIGIPPLSGFWAKVMIIKGGIETDAKLAITVVVAYSLLTFIPLIRIWSSAFWSATPDHVRSVDLDFRAGRPSARLLTLPAIGLVVIILAIGLMPEPLLQIANLAAAEILEPDAYLHAVLGDRADNLAGPLEQHP